VLEIEQVEVARAAAHRREGDTRAVRRPGRREDLIEIGERPLPQHAAARHVEDGDHRMPALQRRQREPAAARIPRAGRLEELQAVEMRIRGGADQLPDHRAGRRVGEVDVDRVAVTLGQEHDLRPVGAERRRDVHAARAASTADGDH